jgi:hypothetical protein
MRRVAPAVGVVTFGRNSNQQVTFQTQIINVQPGVETLDVAAAQNLLIIVESNGQVLLFNLTTNSIVAHVNVQGN